MWLSPVMEWRKWNDVARRMWEMSGSDIPVNSFESQEAYLVQMAVPGVKAEDVDMDVKENILTIRVKRADSLPEGFKVVHREISRENLEQQLRLPRDVNSEAIEASVSDGLLMIHIPKTEKAEARKIEVK